MLSPVQRPGTRFSRNPSAPRSGPQWVFALALLPEEIEARRSRAPGSPRAGREASHPEPCPPAPRSAEGGKEQRSESASRSTDWPAGQSRSGQTPHLTDDRGRGDAPATQAPTHTLAPTILPQPFEGALALPPLRRWASLGTGEPRRRPEATRRVSGSLDLHPVSRAQSLLWLSLHTPVKGVPPTPWGRRGGRWIRNNNDDTNTATIRSSDDGDDG